MSSNAIIILYSSASPRDTSYGADFNLDAVVLDFHGREVEAPFFPSVVNILHQEAKQQGFSSEGDASGGAGGEGSGADTPRDPNRLFWWLTSTTTEAPVTTTANATAELASTCGGVGRIVGGTVATPGAWPWTAAVRSKGGGQFCGGTLVSWRHVVTAAHCIKGGEKRFPLKVSVGIHNVHSTGSSAHVAHALYHRDYAKGSAYNNDIAVLVLTEAVGPATGVVPACLPSPGSSLPSGAKVTVVGWGATSEGGPSSSLLKQVEVDVLESSICSSSYGPSFSGQKMICAGKVRGGKDSCQGDSGGPLTYQQGRWTLVGVVSYGSGCARPNFPGVYTRVSHYISWINEAMRAYP
ncbi:trypsin-like [Penaeus japonicus]|uniref:trypsin-like n=1 Tax=Penaeus japonicus TaxID=27405 RepID=UPI001C70FC8F|nr:trypsin-like [Penaeus japonicus]